MEAVTVEIAGKLTPMRAIRAKCLDCTLGALRKSSCALLGYE